MALIPIITGYNWEFGVIRNVFGDAVYGVVSNFSSENPKDINSLW